MKRSIPLLLIFFCFTPLILNYSPRKSPPRPEFHHVCERLNKTQPLNYLGTNLTLAFEDYKNLLLCPGDAIGDLSETYVQIGECNLTMYHKDKIIWSKGRGNFKLEGECKSDDYCFCVFSLKGDGNLVLHQEDIWYSGFGGSDLSRRSYSWGNRFGPTKTELMVKDEQVQIIRTFEDETQRFFYLDGNHSGFTEDMGKPIKKADKLIIKSHQDEDKTILRRNEYIGDLNGIHLILQPNCKLQLLNKNKTIWSVTADAQLDIPCTLDIAQDNTIEIAKRWMNQTWSQQRIMESKHLFVVVESRITFSDKEPIIYQTLKNGSEIIFYGGCLNRQLRQITQKALIDQNPEGYKFKGSQFSYKMERMEYLGDLTGLHLILEQNCSLILANGNEKLWELQSEILDSSDAVFECSLQFESYGQLFLYKNPGGHQPLLERSGSVEYIGVRLILENDQIVAKRTRKDRDEPDIFYAGRQTNGSFFQFIAQNSVTIPHHNNYETEILPKLGYIGDLNGVYVILDQNCNLVLYNKTQVLWESGTSHHSCGLGLHEDMQVKIFAPMPYDQRKTIWSAMNFRPNPNFGKLLKVELSVAHDELSLIYTFQDGTVKTEKAIRGTNHFTNNLVQFQPQPQTDEEKIIFCLERNPTHHGENLTSNNNDFEDIVLCLGDTFGDLNETYVTLERCFLTMYHKNKKIWTSNQQKVRSWSDEYACAFSLERDGNLVVYSESRIYPYPGNAYSVPWREWDSQTILNPVKSELRLQDQQIQLVQTFGDGTQRLFYADKNHERFTEQMGPRMRADKYIIKSHSDKDKTILRRNEYIGDLNGTYLILQPNCQLQLLNKSKTLWSFIPPFRHNMDCTLNIARDNQAIEISRTLPDVKVDRFDEPKLIDNTIYGRESLIKHTQSQKIAETVITFQDDRPIIVQTLENELELIFIGVSGQNSGLIPKRKLTQIAPRTLVLTKNDVLLRRMNYIGNLTGLHLILEHNCSLILANGNEKLWEFQIEPHSPDDPLMECSVTLESSGRMYLERNFVIESRKRQYLIDDDYFSEKEKGYLDKVVLILENDQIIVKKNRVNERSDIFYAGPTTNGYFFEFLDKSSRTIKLYNRHSKELLPKMGFIGDLNGVYTVFDKKCNWILYNKTQVLWESGTSGDYFFYQLDNGELEMRSMGEKVWSAFDSSAYKGSFNKVFSVEVLVKNDGLWLIYTFKDGATHQYKAIIGTNHFGLVSKGYGKSFGLEL